MKGKQMKIYVLLGGYDHLSKTLLGVYASKEEAVEMRHSRFIAGDYHKYIVETREVGRAAGEAWVFDDKISEYI